MSASPKPTDAAAAAASVAAAPAYASKVIHRFAVLEQGKHAIDFGHGCVVHPYATFRATNGPIVVGEYCVFEDEATVENNLPPNDDGTARVLRIGNFNIFAARSEVQACKVGSYNRFHPYASVGAMSVVEDGCVFTAATRVTHDVLVPSDTVVHGAQSAWRSRTPHRPAEEAEVVNMTRWLRKNLKP
jgi:carbonic anhydrase/acetyltransferase-like protein (isoleucine patch superfamily)